MKLKFESVSGLHISACSELKYVRYIGNQKEDDVVEGCIKYSNEGFFYMSECIHGALYAIELFCDMDMDDKVAKLVILLK